MAGSSGKIVSALVFTKVDRSGTPRTEGWFTCEFEGAYDGDGGYEGGNAFNLSPYFRRLEFVMAQPVSGGSLRDSVSGGTALWKSGSQVIVVPVVQDFGTPASARFQIWGQPNYPSVDAAILSGKTVASGFGITQLASGPTAAISGVRFVAHAIGY